MWTGRGQRADRKSSGSHGPEMREVGVSPGRDDNIHTSRDCQAASTDSAQATFCAQETGLKQFNKGRLKIKE